ncbi:MAG: hypothetical protein AAFV95_14110 [Bacteroidota bacterium]
MAQAPDPITIFEHYYSKQIIDVKVTIDMDSLLTESKKAVYVPGEMQIGTGDSITSWNVRMRQRGKTRRRLCDFPPLKLKFYDTELATSGFATRDEFKVVTHCFEGEEGTCNLLKEYSAYKIYNELCPASFRVLLMRIEYHDSFGRREPMKRMAFLIENKKELASRLGAKVKERYGMTRDSMDEKQFMFLSVFQYLIGNTDWAVPIKHNLLLIEPKGEKKTLAIPYDFDFSGLVNAAYARPNPNLRQVSVTDRIFMAHSGDMEVLEQVLQRFKDVKDRIMAVCDENPVLNQSQKEEMKLYLEGFYQQVRSPAKFRRKIIDRAIHFKHKI